MEPMRAAASLPFTDDHPAEQNMKLANASVSSRIQRGDSVSAWPRNSCEMQYTGVSRREKPEGWEPVIGREAQWLLPGPARLRGGGEAPAAGGEPVSAL